ncbi:MAG: site-2 protease family protein, partial [Anaerolineales bacterium]
GLFAYLAIAQPGALLSFGLVLFIWVFSLTLHEFSHAAVAYMGGDYTVKDKGYLTFNPLKYTHPLLSIILPLVFLALGGIGLPGGAVYIEKHRLRSPWWATAVSLAGPASNLLMAALLAIPFAVGLLEVPNIQAYIFFGSPDDVRIEAALAFSILLQFTAVVLNLLPIPPLDGFQALAPWIPQHIVQQAFSFGFLPLLLLFFMFSVPSFANPFWDQIEQMMDWVSVPYWLALEGLDMFRFWN